MQVLIVHAHPNPDSYSRALVDAALRGLAGAGHRTSLIDLYADGFQPAMTAEERRAYETDAPILDPDVADHAQSLTAADALVFVYPTWWWGLPAMLKGWLERVLVPGVAFTLDDGGVRPNLTQVRRLVGITTYGSSRAYIRLVNDAGRRTISRTLRLVCHRRTRTTWLGLYSIDSSSDAERAEFLTRVERTMAAL